MTKLSFGVFLNPSRDRSSSITHISQTAEHAGFDHTSMQDHPHTSGSSTRWPRRLDSVSPRRTRSSPRLRAAIEALLAAFRRETPAGRCRSPIRIDQRALSPHLTPAPPLSHQPTFAGLAGSGRFVSRGPGMQA
jgi:hypothetical protein